jgi:nitroimidazol reductase NimA-like FMN-containing flavoprotein (pyridoxamine 5'-phosphate oxidase superfamily)
MWPSEIVGKWPFRGCHPCVDAGQVAITEPLSPTSRSTVVRGRRRARSDRAELYDLLDEALICHLGVLIEGAPVVLPTGYGRAGDVLYVHGSVASRSLAAGAELPVSVAVTLVDGVVYARSSFHCSMNYRSAVVHGNARPVTEPDEVSRALAALTDHLAPGTWDHARKPNRKELAATRVLALDLTEASVKMRTGPPADEPEDVEAAVTWAGVLPVRTVVGTPEPCPLLPADIAVPPHVAARRGADRAPRP